MQLPMAVDEFSKERGVRRNYFACLSDSTLLSRRKQSRESRPVTQTVSLRALNAIHPSQPNSLPYPMSSR